MATQLGASGLVSGLARARGVLDSLLEALDALVSPTLARFSGKRDWAAFESDHGIFYFIPHGAPRATKPVRSEEISAQAMKRLRKSPGLDLRIAEDRLISVTFKIPAGANDYIDQIIQHRLERLTPWHPEHVAYGYVTAKQADGQMEVKLLAMSRSTAEETLERLAAKGFKAVSIGSAADALTGPPIIDLFMGSLDQRRGARRRNLLNVAAGIWILSLAAMAGAFLFQSTQDRRLVDIQNQSVRLRQEIVAETSAGNGERAQQLIAEKTADRSLLVFLNRLAAAIPDTTYLDQFERNESTVRLIGSSTNASSLIPALTSALPLADTRFDSPVVRQADGRDRFEVIGRWTTPGVQP